MQFKAKQKCHAAVKHTYTFPLNLWKAWFGTNGHLIIFGLSVFSFNIKSVFFKAQIWSISSQFNCPVVEWISCALHTCSRRGGGFYLEAKARGEILHSSD